MEKELFASNEELEDRVLHRLQNYVNGRLKKLDGEEIEISASGGDGSYYELWHVKDITVLTYNNLGNLIEVVAYGDKKKIESLERKLSLKEFAKKTLLEKLGGE